MKTNLFPFATYRTKQKELIATVRTMIRNNKSLLLKAPTGIGKTVTVLVSTLETALATGKQVWFLTNRSSQHQIVIDTIKRIRAKGTIIYTTDLIGKSHYCLQSGMRHDFYKNCKILREELKCDKCNTTVSHLINQDNYLASEIKTIGKKLNACPYYLSLRNLRKSHLVIGDYYLLFSPAIREILLTSAKQDLSDIILIIDEIHNLPERLRSLLSMTMTTTTLRRAYKQALQLHLLSPVLEPLYELHSRLQQLSERSTNGQAIAFTDIVADKQELQALLSDLSKLPLDEFDTIYDTDALLLVQEFLQKLLSGLDYCIKAVKGKTDGFIFYCLDTTTLTKQVFDSVACYIGMSATLPSETASKDLYGSDATYLATGSVFPPENLKTVIVTGVTSRYRNRTEEMYALYAKHLQTLSETTEGNILAFFTSYGFRDEILRRTPTTRTVLLERENDSQSKQETIRLFLQEKHAMLCASLSGSFVEGIDLPVGSVSTILIFGLPLPTPTIESKELQALYDKRFGKGYEYAYQIPAMTKVIQASGRLIRNEEQKGTVVLLDERYSYGRYRALMPTDWNPTVLSKP